MLWAMRVRFLLLCALLATPLGAAPDCSAIHGIELPDRQLACAPVDSPEGQKYLGAMRAAANYAWCNRQLLMWQARECFARVFGKTWEQLQMSLIYDVAHNIAKFEKHTVNDAEKSVWVPTNRPLT